jgi:hypothetical protein
VVSAAGQKSICQLWYRRLRISPKITF